MDKMDKITKIITSCRTRDQIDHLWSWVGSLIRKRILSDKETDHVLKIMNEETRRVIDAGFKS